MNVRYSKDLLGWIVSGKIGNRDVVVISKDMARAMALYRLAEDAGTSNQTVYLDSPELGQLTGTAGSPNKT